MRVVVHPAGSYAARHVADRLEVRRAALLPSPSLQST
jgi:hypothetical protein